MNLKAEQDLLARLYTDRKLREEFVDKASDDADRARELAAAASDEVKWFAESLVTKRLREVEKLLPLTRQRIGSQEFEKRFRAFADKFSPTTVKKHLEDALGFADELISDNTLERIVRDLSRFESRKLRHYASDRRLSLCSLRFDPRHQRRPGIGFWVAIGRWSRLFFRPA